MFGHHQGNLCTLTVELIGFSREFMWYVLLSNQLMIEHDYVKFRSSVIFVVLECK